MSASAWTVYTQAALATMQGAVNWGAGTIRCALLTGAYTPAPNTDATWASIAANEASGTGYTAGGAAVTGASVAANGATVTASGTIPAWTASTVAARYAVLYDSASGRLLAYSDLTGGAGGAVSTTNGTFSVSGYSVAGTHTP